MLTKKQHVIKIYFYLIYPSGFKDLPRQDKVECNLSLINCKSWHITTCDCDECTAFVPEGWRKFEEPKFRSSSEHPNIREGIPIDGGNISHTELRNLAGSTGPLACLLAQNSVWALAASFRWFLSCFCGRGNVYCARRKRHHMGSARSAVCCVVSSDVPGNTRMKGFPAQ